MEMGNSQVMHRKIRRKPKKTAWGRITKMHATTYKEMHGLLEESGKETTETQWANSSRRMHCAALKESGREPILTP